VDGQSAAPGSTRLIFKVKDDGVGVAKEKLKDMFEPFSQVGQSSHAKYGGTGLGLSISKSLVEMMGGEIWADSKVGKGSTFYFTAVFGLAEEVAHTGPESVPDAPPPSGALRILLAEDNKINQILMVTLLKQQGHHVEVAEDGLEAITKLKAGDFDLVLMDELMPEMSGTEAVVAIRSGAAGPDKAGVKVVALTAHALKGDRERFLAAGMDDYLSKPFPMEELASVLARMTDKQTD